VLDLLLGKLVAVVGVMHEELVPVEQDAEPGAMPGLDRRPQVGEQGFDLAPLDVAADRVAEDRFKNMPVLVAHDVCSL
jgi:hypothetical protein